MSDHIFISGPASWNQLVLLDKLPEPVAQTVHARRHHESIGGTSAGKALNLRALGNETTLFTLLGGDPHGVRVRRALEEAGVQVVPGTAAGPTEQHLNLMTERGERLSIYLATPSLVAGGTAVGTDGLESAVAARALAGARVAVIDLAAHSVPMLSLARGLGVDVWTDIHDYNGTAAFHQPFIDAASHIFMNADGLPDPRPFMARTIAAGAQLVVCTLGADGAIALDAGGREYAVEAAAVDSIVDTNGAGDAFLSGYLHAHLAGGDVDHNLAAAAQQAALVLRSNHLHPVLDEILGAAWPATAPAPGSTPTG
ncbi:carbohydrate kinase family protein [Arthrobacter sp. 35W]|uniref:carbohydrate kinase family protein n=1 Tax=Arthrobacter sp. 35W TaxID=1132441 RepID=UPI000411E12D|nr:carbohydrate kinase family protein [Arthrobacter sp. 35W]